MGSNFKENSATRHPTLALSWAIPFTGNFRMPIPSHISELDEHYQRGHALTQDIRVKGKRVQQTGYLKIDHPEHGPIQVDLQTGAISAREDERPHS